MKIGWRRVISNHGIFHSIFAYFKQNYKGKKKLHVKLFNKDNSQSTYVLPRVFYNSSLCLYCQTNAFRPAISIDFGTSF